MHSISHSDGIMLDGCEVEGKVLEKGRNYVVFVISCYSRFIVHILLTHPVAYFYYLILLGGIVWDILGSCWVATAFRHYTSGFAACYLVCVILSWVSTIMSPLFVLFGFLVSCS